MSVELNEMSLPSVTMNFLVKAKFRVALCDDCVFGHYHDLSYYEESVI